MALHRFRTCSLTVVTLVTLDFWPRFGRATPVSYPYLIHGAAILKTVPWVGLGSCANGSVIVNDSLNWFVRLRVWVCH